jgi:mannosyltransferase OCH1-like enzyme
MTLESIKENVIGNHVKPSFDTYKTVREFFPDANDEFCEFIIWEKTGYPSFWNIPEDGKTPYECFRKQIRDFKQETEK